MGILSSGVLFLALDIERLLRDTPAWLVVVVCVLAATAIFGAFYLSMYFKDLKRMTAAAAAERKMTHEKQDESPDDDRQKRQAQRKAILSKVPSGPVPQNKLPPATLRIRNRVENVSSDAEFTIGKLPDNDLVVAELGVSKKHAKIRPEKTCYMLFDLASSNGTLVNGKRIMKKPLHDEDKIRIGPETLVFKLDE